MSPFDPLPIILPLASPSATLEAIGGKGASLARLAAAGLPVPAGFHVTTDAYRRFVAANQLGGAILGAAAEARAEDPASLEAASARIRSLIASGTIPDDIADSIRDAYAGLGASRRPDAGTAVGIDGPSEYGNGLGPPAVAVRSSATAEDLPEMSFAGQQETYLNVRGPDQVVEAIRRCWSSLWTARALGYRARHGISPEDVSLAVVVQLLVPAESAGVLFTANPVTGARGEMVISAAWGLGEAIVGGMVTPDSIVVNKASGTVKSEEIADKATMTVRTPAGTHEVPVPAEKRRQPALGRAAVAQLVPLGILVEQYYGQPMDIEWAWQGGRIHILQARPITSLPDERPTLDWTVPREAGKYARSSVIELLPDPLSPLFATLALPLWSDAMQRLMQLFKFGDVLPEPSLVTINDYAFYDYGMSPGQSARMMAAFFGRMPALFRIIGQAEARWSGEGRPRYVAAIAAGSARDVVTAPSSEILATVHAIVNAAADHYLTIQSGLLPVAYISEAIFTAAYNRLARREGDPPALNFMLGFESAPIRAEKDLYDIATWATTQSDLAAYLAVTPSAGIAADLGYGTPNAVKVLVPATQAAPIPDADAWREFGRQFAAHLDRYGHVVYDLDFQKRLPAEDPGPLLEAMKYYLTGQARNPYERQAAAAAAREAATTALFARLKGPRLRLFRKLLPWARRYGPLREDGLADVGLGWPLVRQMLREVGRRLVAAGAFGEPDEVYWLTWEELQGAARALDAGASPGAFAGLVSERRERWTRERQVTPPVVLPQKTGARFLGLDFSRFMPAHTDQAAGDTIKGIGASPGRVAGTARVIHGPAEFGAMKPGDILVTKITTPAWTPLFALAAGIVTDVGGPLSHSSIVAREYHIPAVLGTGVATERIESGRRITVDGDEGVVKLEP